MLPLSQCAQLLKACALLAYAQDNVLNVVVKSVQHAFANTDHGDMAAQKKLLHDMSQILFRLVQ